MTVERDQMVAFLSDRLETIYTLEDQGRRHLVVKERPEVSEDPRTFYIFTHSNGNGIKEVVEVCESNAKEGIATAHVFYGDGEVFRRKVEGAVNIASLRRNMSVRARHALYKLKPLERQVLLEMGYGELTHFIQEDSLFDADGNLLTCEHLPAEQDYGHINERSPAHGRAESGTSKSRVVLYNVDEVPFGDPATLWVLKNKPMLAVLRSQRFEYAPATSKVEPTLELIHQ